MERFRREAREMVMGEADALLHSLFCEECGLRAEAVACLLIAGWSEGDFLEEVVRRSGERG